MKEQEQQQDQRQRLFTFLLKKNRRRRNLLSRLSLSSSSSSKRNRHILPRSSSSSRMVSLWLLLAIHVSSSLLSPSIVVQAEDAASYDYSDLSGHLKLMRHCDVNIVYVNSIYLTCDSPGSYYYGSGGYRKSSRCKYGDKADMYIFFTISDSYGWYGIDVTIDMGVLASFSNVQPQTALCDLGSITYLGDKATSSSTTSSSSSSSSSANYNNIYCPTPGNYLLRWSFTMPSGGADRQLQFLPDMRIKFNAKDGNATLGCAGTGTVATVQNAVMHTKEGEIALGIALSAFFIIFGCCLAMSYRRKKQAEEETKGRSGGQAVHRRYYFVRNSKTGELVPIHRESHSPNPLDPQQYSPNHLDPQQYDPQHYEPQQHHHGQQQQGHGHGHGHGHGQHQQEQQHHQQHHGHQQQQHHHQHYPPSAGYAPSTASGIDQYSYAGYAPSTASGNDQYSYESYDNTTLGESEATSWQQQHHRGRLQPQPPPQLDKSIVRV